MTVDVKVDDPDALIAYARERVEEMWPGSSLDELQADGEELAERALYEALIASSPGPLPDGIEIHDVRFEGE